MSENRFRWDLRLYYPGKGADVHSPFDEQAWITHDQVQRVLEILREGERE